LIVFTNVYLISPLQITVYLGKRDFVDHVGEVDPIGELGREGGRRRGRGGREGGRGGREGGREGEGGRERRKG
jgi:hypothetical protein